MSEAFSSQIREDQIRLTPMAAEKIAGLVSSVEDEDIEGIRIFVSGGGCGGMTYGMTYTDQAHPHDSVMDGEGFRLFVDPVALNYLEGCEIDFTSQGANASFVFNNVFQAVGGSGACGGCGAGGGGGGCGG
ncbi:MAG: iron-sulfur cluster assembly accessory protein [Gammaproteobacteria bacterium]|jgi:iron-sulfur cluster assembly accessory protein|nr:iron-sulfur cluster assembly accessory protein [Gammaproteobacteria bacterium]